MRLLVFFLLGGLLGAAASAALSARFIHWWAVPPFPTGCDVGPAIEYAVTRLLLWEGIGAAIGAIGLLILYLVVRARGRKNRPAAPAPAAPGKSAPPAS